MNKYSTDKIRNIALASHSGTGKTSIVESMLFNSKVITRIGNVEEGNTASDYEQEETKRKTNANKNRQTNIKKPLPRTDVDQGSMM